MDYPYEVPTNWEWVKLPDVCEYIRGGDKPQTISEIETSEYKIPVIANGIQNDGIIGYSNIEDEKAGTITVSGRGTIGHAVLRNYSYFPVVRLIVLAPNKSIMPMYMKYIFDSFEEKGIGSSIPQLTIPFLKKKVIPLPPLPEQHRIVARIESLFSKLDEAKEKAQSILDGFENRRAAILHKAFTGELTKKWRDERGIGFDSWETKNFGEIATVKSNLVDPKDYQDFPHIAPDNIEKKTGRLLEYHTIAEDKVTSGKHRFFAGQILYSKLRPYLSKVIIINFDGLCSSDMYPIEATTNINAKYLWYLMLSYNFLQQASMAMSGITLPRIGQKELAMIKMHITTYPDEQLEIVRILDRLLSQEQEAKQAAEAVIAQIDVMKKSILARAFRGELGTNDPSDEPVRV